MKNRCRGSVVSNLIFLFYCTSLPVSPEGPVSPGGPTGPGGPRSPAEPEAPCLPGSP